VVHELYDTPEIVDAVVRRFGPDVAPAGVVDRAAVAKRAFANTEDRAWLERLLWPRVGARMAQWRAGLEHADPPPRAAIVEVPLLFEADMENAFDATIAVIAEEELRCARAAARGHAALDERGARQLTQYEKAARATYVVLNDASVARLESELSAVLEKVKPS
jgi:dephospho-CoA kinase